MQKSTNLRPTVTQPIVNPRTVSVPRRGSSFSASIISPPSLNTGIATAQTNLIGIFNAEQELTARALGQ
jgi:hypothetical protein